jgi:hypothetical protein
MLSRTTGRSPVEVQDCDALLFRDGKGAVKTRVESSAHRDLTSFGTGVPAAGCRPKGDHHDEAW